ncbi:MAG: hypothetical protein ABFE13_13470 [Phycisphaerales bacterium]
MKTVEVAIEYVLTGLLALCAFGLPFTPWYGLDGKTLGARSDTLLGILGLAYLIGVIFDKIADTLLSPFDQWLRLRVACRRQDKTLCYSEDGFPQDILEFALRDKGGDCLEWMDSLRSRIRTARGLAVLGLPAVLGIAVYRDWDPLSPSLWRPFPHLVIAFNALFILVALLLSTSCRINRPDRVKKQKRAVDESAKAKQWPSTRSQCPAGSIGNQGQQCRQPASERWRPSKWFEIPRTNELVGDRADRANSLRRAKRNVWIRASPFVIMQAVSAVAVIVLACSQSKSSLSPEYVVLAAAGTVLALLALWVWYQITDTYMRFVAQRS